MHTLGWVLGAAGRFGGLGRQERLDSFLEGDGGAPPGSVHGVQRGRKGGDVLPGSGVDEKRSCWPGPGLKVASGSAPQRGGRSHAQLWAPGPRGAQRGSDPSGWRTSSQPRWRALCWPSPPPPPQTQACGRARLPDVGKDISTERAMEPLGMLPEVGAAPFPEQARFIGGGRVWPSARAAPGAWGGTS